VGVTRQFVVQLENRPGALAGLARVLGDRGIDIRQLAGGGMGVVGYAVIETDADEATADALHAAGLPFIAGEPLLTTLEDRPGALATLVDRLGVGGVSVHGVMVVGRREGELEVALIVDDPDRASQVLGLP
jgi:hypothetical protein